MSNKTTQHPRLITVLSKVLTFRNSNKPAFRKEGIVVAHPIPQPADPHSSAFTGFLVDGDLSLYRLSKSVDIHWSISNFSGSILCRSSTSFINLFLWKAFMMTSLPGLS